MKRFLIALMMVFTMQAANAVSYNADVPGWSDLSDTQKAEIKLKAAQAAEAQSKVPVSANEVQEWVNVGKSIGVGFGAAAKEIGVGVDELMKSDTGKIAMFLIVWHYIGDQMLGVIGGVLWFLLFIPLWLRMFGRYGTEPTYTKNDSGDIVATNYEIRSDESVVYFSIVAILIFLVGFILIF